MTYTGTITLCFSLITLLFCSSQFCQAAESPKVPQIDSLKSMPSSKVSPDYIDRLKAAADFDDYQVECHLLTQKEDNWKAFGSAHLLYKRHDLLRAVIKSSDYRNGSVLVKQSDGKIRGQGGGLLKAMKMTIEPDSRTLRLPTGYSIAESDFVSLYDSMKTSLAKGVVATSTKTPVTLSPFSSPVQVLFLKEGENPDSKTLEVVFIDPQSKTPLAWNTYKEGKPHAFVFFEGLVKNKGLAEDLFHI